MGEANGLLVQARQNPLIYTFIALIISVILLFILLSLFLRYIERLHSSPEWIEAHKSLPTKKKNVKHVAREAELETQEEKLLYEICKEYSVPNIEFTYHENERLDEYFKQKYFSFDSTDAGQKKALLLFSLRYKIEKAKEKNFFISSTKALKAGHELYYFDENSFKWVFTIQDNVKNGIYIKIPPELLSSEKRPAPLSKINISFNTKAQISYGFVMRIIRYEKQKDESELMFASHSSSLMPIQRRKTKRMAINKDCLFAAVKVSKDKIKGNFYEVKENRYKGKLLDISASGAKMQCSMPIKKSQFIYLDFELGETVKEHAIGQIVATNKAINSEDFILHIQFMDIELAASNKIYAYIYGYLV